MHIRDALRGLILGLLSGGVALTPAFALEPPIANGGAQVEVGSEEGLPNMPEVTQDEDVSTEEEFNPTITCTVGPGESIADLIDCLVDKIANPPPPCADPPDIGTTVGGGGVVEDQYAPDDPPGCVTPYDRSDFDVYALPDPFWGVEIVRLDGDPMVRILFRENDPGIQTTQVKIDNIGRIGRIGEVTETPACDGAVIVTVNDDVISVPTSIYCSSVQITGQIVTKLQSSGYIALYSRPYITIVDQSTEPDAGIRRIQFRSTDSGITASDLALLPPGGENAPPGPTGH